MISTAMAAADLWEGEMVGITVAGRPVLLLHVAGEVHAYEDRCAHLGVRLSGGCLDEHVLTCGAHEWCYDARTGRGINPGNARLRALPCEVRGGVIYVDVAAREKNDG